MSEELQKRNSKGDKTKEKIKVKDKAEKREGAHTNGAQRWGRRTVTTSHEHSGHRWRPQQGSRRDVT